MSHRWRRWIRTRRVSKKSYYCCVIKVVGSPNIFLFFYFFVEEVEKGLLRSLSPVKKEESNELEATDFLSSFLLSTSEEKSSTFSKSISRTALTFDGRMFLSTSIGDSYLKIVSKIDEGDYKPSPELLDLFSKLPDGLSSTTRKDAVVKSESEIVNDTVLRYGMLCLFKFHCCA